MDPRIKKLFEYGHHLNPKHGLHVGPLTDDELDKLVITDVAAKNMIASWQEINGLLVDGDLGPITEESFTVERCDVPDYAMAAGGRTFNQPCRSEGIRFSFNSAKRPSNFSEAQESRMIDNVVSAYRFIGCPMVRVDVNDNEMIRAYWHKIPRRGVIGLAQLTNGPCNDELFCQIHPNYASAGLVQMSALFCHEVGHNVGLGHSNGGIMSPSIVQLRTWRGWVESDPSYRILTQRSWYGGDPLDTPTPDPPESSGIKLVVSHGGLKVTAFNKDDAELGQFSAHVSNGKLEELLPWSDV